MNLKHEPVSMYRKTIPIDNGLITLEAKDIEYEAGKNIWLRVKGFQGNTTDSETEICQLMLEFYEGYLQIHVWDGSGEDSKGFEIPYRPEYKKVVEAKRKELPLLIDVEDTDAKELLLKRLKGVK